MRSFRKNSGRLLLLILQEREIVNDAVEITSVLSKEEVVITSGASLLNSEYSFEHDSNPIGGMKVKI